MPSPTRLVHASGGGACMHECRHSARAGLLPHHVSSCAKEYSTLAAQSMHFPQQGAVTNWLVVSIDIPLKLIDTPSKLQCTCMHVYMQASTGATTRQASQHQPDHLHLCMHACMRATNDRHAKIGRQYTWVPQDTCWAALHSGRHSTAMNARTALRVAE